MTVDPPIANQQISLFNNLNNNAEINAILTELDLDEITPRQAMDILADLKEKAVKTMAKIHLLDSSVYNLIAAGEVVENQRL